jgi:guanylate kinase
LSSGKLLVFSAPSGSGKTTLVQHLLTQALPLEFSISATSRPPRAHEVDGKEYYFLTPEAFKEKIKANAFVEYEEVYEGLFYGTLRTELERIWNKGKHGLFDIDVQGGLNIKRQYPEQTLTVFVQPPNLGVLKNRLEQRGTETPESLQQRLAKAEAELQFADRFDVVIVNDDLEKAKQEAVERISAFLNS